MVKTLQLRRAIKIALLSGVAAGSVTSIPAVYAQNEQVEEITVTGSRIARRDAIAESPIYTFDSSALENSGFVTLDHFMNTLPQITPNISSQSNNPSSGGRAFIDLRGLGTTRNLVLIDGRRAIGQAAGGTVVDTNAIPAALIDRVEIISGGAAATYGADAIAGVVNFIMKKSFDGVAFNHHYGASDEGDGDEMSSDLTFGGDFADGLGSAVFNASYFKRDAMYKDAREFSAQASAATGIFPNGSWSPGTNAPSVASIAGIFGAGTCSQTGGSGGFGFNPDGSLFCTGVSGNSALNIRGYTGPQSHVATQFAPDRFSYNFEPDNILVLPLERWNLYSHLELDLSESFRPYVTASFTNYNASQELAATPVGGLVMPATNPFMPAQLRSVIATRPTPAATLSFNKRFSALGGRTGDNTHDVWQLTTGTKGDLWEGWSYDVYGSYGRSVRNEVQGGNVKLPETNALLAAADGGRSLCTGGLNLFGNAEISQSCQNYISLQAKNLTVVETGNFEAVLNGELFELPAGVVRAAFGASWRETDFDFKPDAGLRPGIVAGFNEQLPVGGYLNYRDLFAEVIVPILTGVNLVQNLSTTLGYRVTDNNVFGSEESWKATFDWSIVDGVRARGGMQYAIRSPNIDELFAPQLNNFPNFANQDPCNFNSSYRTGASAAAVRSLCTGQAAIAGSTTFSQPFGQAQAIVGGNPNLTPETADSWSFGFVLNPEFNNRYFERATFTIDYFSIEMDEVISSVGATTIINRCYNNEGANPSFSLSNEWCRLFNRDPADGRVINLQQFQRNQSVLEISGIDFTANTSFEVGPGDLGISVLASWLEKSNSQVTAIDPVNDFMGTIGSGTGSATPEWRATFMTSYTMDNFRVQLTSRYIDDMSHSALVTNPLAVATGVKDTWYMDLSGNYDLTENISVRTGINNLRNQEPRLYSPNIQANTDPSTYDVVGRRYFIGLQARF